MRIGGSRTSQDFNELCVKLSQAWREAVSEKDASTGSVERKLAGAFVLRSINAMWEHGFVLPEVSFRMDHGSISAEVQA